MYTGTDSKLGHSLFTESLMTLLTPEPTPLFASQRYKPPSLASTDRIVRVPFIRM